MEEKVVSHGLFWKCFYFESICHFRHDSFPNNKVKMDRNDENDASFEEQRRSKKKKWIEFVVYENKCPRISMRFHRNTIQSAYFHHNNSMVNVTMGRFLLVFFYGDFLEAHHLDNVFLKAPSLEMLIWKINNNKNKKRPIDIRCHWKL